MISVSSIANEQSSEQLILIAQAADTRDSGASEPQSVPSGKWISNGEHLGKWWKKRARKFATLPPEWLYHLEGEYSLSGETGNTEETYHKGKLTLSLRKGLVNSNTSFTLEDQEQGEGSEVRTKEKMILDEFVYIELWEKIDLSGDLQWYTYNKRYIEDRYSAFAGLYFTFFDLPDYTLKLGTFYGYTTISYMNDEIAKKNPELSFPDYSSDTLYIKPKFIWSVNDKLTFTLGGGYWRYLKDSDFFNWKLNFDLDYQLTKHVSIFGSYDVEYESSEIDQKLQGSEKRDAEFNVGIRINY